ncbi:LutC/YkgG family protein [Brevibacillus migulae]|uniref:LutC/YkgG family protein n=1 Tax=Brevibacillus migulae TaxID=1644114 RepID=UPI00106E7965|nr:LUD domain-containing protein [Brevibacillus migulae]
MKTEKKSVIAELHEQSLQKQETFIKHIANRLGREQPLTTPPKRSVSGAVDSWRTHTLDPEERISQFLMNWESLGGSAVRLADMAEAKNYLDRLIGEMKAKKIIREDHPELAQIVSESPDLHLTVWGDKDFAAMRKAAAEAEIGIVMADFAIANTGTLVITSTPQRGRSLSLLPTIFVGIVKAKDIQTKMGDVLSVIQTWNGKEMPAGIHFVSGPSRSADIESDLTIGVHGPSIVHALVIG